MMVSIHTATATADAEEHADWLELCALVARDKNCSIQDLIQALRRSGTTDALADDDSPFTADPRAEWSERVAQDGFSEIEDRLNACGGAVGAYPFQIHTRYLQLMRGYEHSPYVFMLLLSYLGKDAGPPGSDGAELFEEICEKAAEVYFGGCHAGVETYLFGFPRRVAPRDFPGALDDLCQRMGEGVGCRQRPTVRDQKDAKLDVAVWRSFPDQRQGKLIGFGQCATGKNWRDKLGELQPGSFCKMWMKDVPAVDPVRLFFVPFRLNRSLWLNTSHHAGITFDRCRIAFHAREVGHELGRACRDWSLRAIMELRA